MLKVIREQLHIRLLNIRRLAYVINQSSFKELWDASTEEERKSVYQHILQGDKTGVLNWCKNHNSLDSNLLPTMNLRKQAMSLGIPNYSRLSRKKLLENLVTYENENLKEMTLADKINYITAIIKELRFELKEAHIPLKILQIRKNQNTEKNLNVAYNWITQIKENEYKAVLKIRELLPMEIWQRYKIWQIGKNREIVLLEKAQNRLKRAIANRPLLFRKKES